MTKAPQPMLAASEVLTDPSILKFPVLVSPKLDGVRCIIKDGVAYGRSGLPIANASVQEWAQENEHELQDYDGELVVGRINDKNAFKNTSGDIRRTGGNPNFTFCVFDIHSGGGLLACAHVRSGLITASAPRVHIVQQVVAHTPEDVQTLHQANIDAGFEGSIVKAMFGTYKQGRATFKSQALLKMKPKKRDEARVVGYEFLKSNHNEAKVDAFGHTKRSSDAGGLVTTAKLGKWLVEGINGDFQGVKYSVGTGFNDAERTKWGHDPDYYIGRIMSVEHCSHGADVRPRHPSFKGWRDHADMSDG